MQALLTHRDVTPELRQRVFGEVHMLSHLMGAANRADLRRLLALEKENADLQDRIQRQHLRLEELVAERDCKVSRLEQENAELRRSLLSSRSAQEAATGARPDAEAVASLVALHTERRERAELAAAAADSEATRLKNDLERLRISAKPFFFVVGLLWDSRSMVPLWEALPWLCPSAGLMPPTSDRDRPSEELRGGDCYIGEYHATTTSLI